MENIKEREGEGREELSIYYSRSRNQVHLRITKKVRKYDECLWHSYREYPVYNSWETRQMSNELAENPRINQSI